MRLTNLSLALFNLMLNVNCEDCDQVLSRPNIYKMNDTDRDRYFNAVKAINSGPKPTDWDKFAKQHFVVAGDIHQKPMFEAWHRKYLSELEKLLRKKDPKIRIPYWDWSEHYDDRENDPIWKWFGKQGNKSKGKCVTEGVFKDFRVFYDSFGNNNGKERCFTRNDVINQQFGCFKQEINDNIIDQSSSDSSWRYLEWNCHNGVHAFIGGDFSTNISTNDPLFFSHHAFVDMIWFTRQMRYPSQYDNYPQSINDKLPTYGIPIKDVLDPTALCYSYNEDSYSWSQATKTIVNQPTATKAPIEPFVPLSEDRSAPNDLSTKAIDDYARGYVFKNIKSPINTPSSTLNVSNCQINPLRDIVSIDYIRKMNGDEKVTRELERKQALYVDNLNKKCL